MPLMLLLMFFAHVHAAGPTAEVSLPAGRTDRLETLSVGPHAVRLREPLCLPQVLETMRALGAIILDVRVELLGPDGGEYDLARFDVRYRRAVDRASPVVVVSVPCALAKN